MTTTIQKRLLGRDESRDYLGGISATTLWRLEIEGQIRSVKIGRRVFFEQRDLDRFIERSRKASAR